MEENNEGNLTLVMPWGEPLRQDKVELEWLTKLGISASPEASCMGMLTRVDIQQQVNHCAR